MLACENKAMKPHRILPASFIFLLVLYLPHFSAASSLVLPEGTRITLQLNDNLSTKSNSEGDSFTAVVMTPVYMGEQIAIPKGSIVSGSISRILRPGRFKGKAAMNLLFHSIRIPGRGGDVPIVAILVRIDPEGNGCIRSEGTVVGESSKHSDIAKVITPGIAGAGIGAVAGRGKAAAIGAGIGVFAGLATVLTSRGKDLEVQRGSTLDIELEQPLTLPSWEGEMALGNR
jgi:hypothetical protein